MLLTKGRCRSLATTSATRVLASLDALQQLAPSKAIKFPWKDDVDGFLFVVDRTPHAYINRCSHVALEMDLNDSDFFTHGVIQCKVHGAMFDPASGLCLRPPPRCKRLSVRPSSSRTSSRVTLPEQPLRRIPVIVEGGNVCLAPPTATSGSGSTPLFDEAYRQLKERELHAKLEADGDAMQEEVDAINRRSMRLVQAARNARPK
ncbi:Aste57867_12973 [Aphanomyces stellatus]|uniref:Aste57867_12973 protein n=1 Tax=Aphanomyces stellatus TaxID=120398 RepID=A0A485KZ16_9STRA|nr:hypothetical protein As57867_012925 [Aphanomyces stellatus]VFT89819.1 Aste57867_12973 [Aphanomyces stellatus]